MPTRRQLVGAACCAVLGGGPARSAAGTTVPVRVWPGARPAFASLSRRVERVSRGTVRLVADARPPGGIAATFGGLAFADASPGPVLELFAGFPFGMAPRELGSWVASREGRALWDDGFATSDRRAFACRVRASPGVVFSSRPIAAVRDIAGFGLECREGGVSASAWRRLGASPARGDGTVAVATCGGDAGVRGWRGGPDRIARTLSPPFGVLLDLALSRECSAAFDHAALGWIELACGLELAASVADAGAGIALDAVPPPLPAEVLVALSCATAAVLRDGVPPRATAGYASARGRSVPPPSPWGAGPAGGVQSRAGMAGRYSF